MSMLYTEPDKAHVTLGQCCFANNEDLGNAYNMRVYPSVYDWKNNFLNQTI